MAGQVGAIGAVNPYMNPMQNTSYMYQMGGMMDDVCARNLYYSLQNNQMPVGATQQYTGGYTTGANPSFNGTSAQTAKKGGIGGPLFGGILAGGATYGGMTLLNHSLNSPIEVIEGNPKFNERFLNHFAGEYAAVQNGDELGKFYKKLGGNSIKAENIDNVFKDFEKLTTKEGFENIEKLAENNKELKAVLVKKGILKPNGEKVDGLTIEKVQSEFITQKMNYNNINAKNNILIQKQHLERTKGLNKAWKACKDSKTAKLEFLKTNCDVLGLEPEQIRKLKFGKDISLEELNKMFNEAKGNIPTNIRTYETNIKNLKKSMQKLAGYWEQDAGFFSRGKFKFEEGGLKTMKKGGKILDALTSATKKMRHGKAWPIALIVGAVTAIGVGLSRNH